MTAKYEEKVEYIVEVDVPECEDHPPCTFAQKYASEAEARAAIRIKRAVTKTEVLDSI